MSIRQTPSKTFSAARNTCVSFWTSTGSTIPTALAAYNWGMGNVDRAGVNNAPLETRNYVARIMGDQAPPAPPQPGGAPSLGQPFQRGPLTPIDQPQPTGAVASAHDPNAFTQIGQIDPAMTDPKNNFVQIGQIDPAMAAPQPPEDVPWYSMKEVPGAFTQGISDATREAAQTASGQAFTDQQGRTEAPHSFMGGAAYGLAHSFPLIAGGIGGAMGGEAVAPEAGPVGPMVGGALGVGGVAAFQAIKPAYDEARQQNMSHEDAMNYAIKRASTEGLIGGATAPLFEISPFRSAIGKMLFTSFATMPAVGAATRIIEPQITGDKAPTRQELLRGAGQDIVGGLALGVGHHLISKALPPKEAPANDKAPPPPR